MIDVDSSLVRSCGEANNLFRFVSQQWRSVANCDTRPVPDRRDFSLPPACILSADAVYAQINKSGYSKLRQRTGYGYLFCKSDVTQARISINLGTGGLQRVLEGRRRRRENKENVNRAVPQRPAFLIYYYRFSTSKKPNSTHLDRSFPLLPKSSRPFSVQIGT